MKKALLCLVAAAAALPFFACSPSITPENLYEVEMYVSLGSTSTLASTSLSLLDYWGKTVSFSVIGQDAGVNTDVNRQVSADLNWTGSNKDNGTQYASARLSLKGASGSYAGGKFTFLMYIDWDNDGKLSTGDHVLASYSIIADTDNNPQTPGIEMGYTLAGPRVSYDGNARSLTIDDPLAFHSDALGLLEKIFNGGLTVY
jgi:hypothetical protein